MLIGKNRQAVPFFLLLVTFFLTLSFTLWTEAKSEKKIDRKMSSEEVLSDDEVKGKLLTLVSNISPLTNILTKSSLMISNDPKSYPLNLGKYKMECNKVTTQKNKEKNGSVWVNEALTATEAEAIEDQFGENGEVELSMELNREVKNIDDVSLVLRVNERFLVDRIMSSEKDERGNEAFQEEVGTKECSQSFKSLFPINETENNKITIFTKTDKTVCGDNILAVNTKIRKAVLDDNITVKEGSFEIFVQHTNVKKSKKVSESKLLSNINVSCNFDPIK
jgi:hypothetical protein